jgi:hypothetical protein
VPFLMFLCLNNKQSRVIKTIEIQIKSLSLSQQRVSKKKHFQTHYCLNIIFDNKELTQITPYHSAKPFH